MKGKKEKKKVVAAFTPARHAHREASKIDFLRIILDLFLFLNNIRKEGNKKGNCGKLKRELSTFFLRGQVGEWKEEGAISVFFLRSESGPGLEEEVQADAGDDQERHHQQHDDQDDHPRLQAAFGL